jgi:tetratricopeptide (TPR) repeat protein
MNAPSLPLELLPLDLPAPARSPDPIPSAAPRPPEIIEVGAMETVKHAEVHGVTPSVDRFAREAAQQYAEGHIDSPLWDRAIAQAGGDKDAAVPIYLKARATALRLLDRESRHEQRAQLAKAAPKAARPAPSAAPASDEEDEDGNAGAQRAVFARKRVLARHRTAIAGGAAAVVLVAVAGWFLFGRSDPPAATAAVRPAPAAAVRASAPAPAPAKAAAADTKAVNAEFMLKLQQFRDTGNWNMVVLYAVEWTRREPANAAAWNELRAGYVNLRQYDDALAAAKRAVDLAPTEAPLWRHLGNAYLDLDDPANALGAFTEAAARDTDDHYSLQQIGLLNARQGRLPEAKSAFDQALVMRPGDPLTQCLKTGVAQMTPQKDPHAAALQVRTLDSKCRGNEAVTDTPAPVAATQRPGTAGGKRAASRS